MNVNAISKTKYIIYLLEKGILKMSEHGECWNVDYSKKELAFIESGYPFEKGITFEQAWGTKARFLGFRNEFAGGVKNPALFKQVKDMADWKRYLSLSQIRYAVWGRA